MNLFSLAMIQLRKERKPQTINNILDYAEAIRSFIDGHPVLSQRIDNNERITPQMKYKYKKQGIKL